MDNGGSGRGALSLLAAAGLAALTLPRLLSFGMHVDGVAYAAVARNLALGEGSPWALRLTSARPFVEHPPLVFWILAPFYQLFGDSLHVEALVGCAFGFAGVAAMVLVWRRLGFSAQGGAWLPVALYAVMPTVSWSFANNQLDLYLAVFTMAAIGVAAAALLAGRWQHAAGLGGLAGALVCAGLLAKGPGALFAFLVPAVAAALLPGVSWRRALAVGGAMLLVPALVAVAIDASPAAHEYMRLYLYNQVGRSLSGERAVVESRLYILIELAYDLWLPLAAVVVLALALRRRARLQGSPEALVLLVLALAASLPLALSPKQAARYLLPSLPLYALTLGAVAAPLAGALERLVRGRRQRVVRALGVIGLAAAVAAMLVEHDRARRHGALYADLVTAPAPLPPHASISACPERLAGFTLRANLARLFDADLRPAPTDFLLADIQSECEPPPACRRVHPPAPQGYVLYDCRPPGTTIR